MAEQDTIKLIEDAKDQMENWSFYTKGVKTEKSADRNVCEATNQQLIYFEAESLVENDNEHSIQYGCDKDDLIDIDVQEQDLQTTVDNFDAQEQQLEDNVGDTSNHNLVLKETVDINGQLVEEYFCQQCNFSYISIEQFLSCHPHLELLYENPDEQEQQAQNNPVSEVTENKLWDLVEIFAEIEESNVIHKDNKEMKEKVAYTNHDASQERDTEGGIEIEDERYFCYDCQQVFTDLETAENHECSSQLENSNDCIIESDSALIADSSSENNIYRCHLCDKECASFRAFSNHQRLHNKPEKLMNCTKVFHDDPVICEICNTIFASEKNLKLHMKMHKKHSKKTIQEALPVGAQSEYNDLNQFFCEICNKSFDQKLLLIHKNMHQNLEEYRCGKCNKKFENLPSYEIHMQMHEDTAKRGVALKKFAARNISNETPLTSCHELNDTSKRKFACQYCGKEFQRPYEKVKHERIHTGEKPYECEVCGKTFRVSYSLTLHLRTHTDIRPFVCATCNKRFKQHSVYVHHLKTHDIDCSYKCDVCGKCFRTSVQLGGHKNIHSKPYNCTECNRPFASLYAVKVHMKTHSKCHKSNKNLKNSCSVCGASYARVFALNLHLKEQHGIDIHPIQLLAANQQNLDTENALLTQAANEELDFIDDVDEQPESTGEVGAFNSQVDHVKNIENALSNNVYMDETEAATQTILNTEEITVDNVPNEEIITDWLSK